MGNSKWYIKHIFKYMVENFQVARRPSVARGIVFVVINDLGGTLLVEDMRSMTLASCSNKKNQDRPKKVLWLICGTGVAL